MRIEELNWKNWKKCTIAIRVDSGIFKMLGENSGKIQAFVYNEGGKSFVQLYFDDNMISRGGISRILSRKDVIRSDNYFSISEELQSSDNAKLIFDLTEMPSVLIEQTYVLGTEIFVIFRFHSSCLSKISNMLTEIIAVDQKVKIVEIVNANDLRSSISEIAKDTKVSVIQISTLIGKDRSTLEFISRNYPGMVSMPEVRSWDKEGIKTIMFSENEPKLKGTSVISAHEKIYESRESDASLIRKRQLANDARIPRFGIIFDIRGGRLYETIFLPAEVAQNYVRTYFEAIEDLEIYQPIIEVFSGLNEEVWKWIQ